MYDQRDQPPSGEESSPTLEKDGSQEISTPWDEHPYYQHPEYKCTGSLFSCEYLSLSSHSYIVNVNISFWK